MVRNTPKHNGITSQRLLLVNKHAHYKIYTISSSKNSLLFKENCQLQLINITISQCNKIKSFFTLVLIKLIILLGFFKVSALSSECQIY